MLPEYKSVVEVLRRGGKGGDLKGAKANMERVINITSSIGRNSEMHHAAVRRYIYTTPHFLLINCHFLIMIRRQLRSVSL